MRPMNSARTLAASLLAAFALVASGCAEGPPDGEEGIGDLEVLEGETPSAESHHDDETDLASLESTDSPEFVNKAACGSRWTLPASTTQAGNRANVQYDGAGNRCQGGPTSGAEALGRYLRSSFPDLVNQSIDGKGIQIYACRNIRGGSGLSVHSTGRAIDVFIPTSGGGGANNGKGDVVANFLVENAERIGIQMLIWDRTIWKSNGGQPRDRCYGGTHPHNDHIHVELNEDGGDMNTPFFQGEPEAPPADDRADSPDPIDNGAPAPGPINRNAWVGDVCATDNDCGFSTDGGVGRCFTSHRPASGKGFCTLDCAGYCPDRQGKAVTFCVSAGLLGGGGGVCVSKAGDANDYCDSPGGFSSVETSRYIGGSGARAGQAEVCLPNGG